MELKKNIFFPISVSLVTVGLFFVTFFIFATVPTSANFYVEDNNIGCSKMGESCIASLLTYGNRGVVAGHWVGLSDATGIKNIFLDQWSTNNEKNIGMINGIELIGNSFAIPVREHNIKNDVMVVQKKIKTKDKIELQAYSAEDFQKLAGVVKEIAQDFRDVGNQTTQGLDKKINTDIIVSQNKFSSDSSDEEEKSIGDLLRKSASQLLAGAINFLKYFFGNALSGLNAVMPVEMKKSGASLLDGALRLMDSEIKILNKLKF